LLRCAQRVGADARNRDPHGPRSAATAAVTTQFISSLLFDVSPVDRRTGALVCAGWMAIAALASYPAARRAAVFDPLEALRTE
jgi:ABC-type lipoprotein release transport system permease subunit